MRILHVITTLDVGGAEMHLLAQARGQVERGHALRIAYLKGGGSLTDDFRAAGVERVVALGANPLRLVAQLRWAEVVHSHLLKADAWTAVWASLTGRRASLISSKHNDEQVLLRPLVSFVHGLVARLPRRTIVLSDHVGRFFAAHGGVPTASLRRIYYGLDPTPFELALADRAAQRARIRAELAFSDADVVFVCVARFAPQKAHEVLLTGFALARKHRPDARLRLLLVGDDPFGDGRRRAERVARQLELGDQVCFAGIRRDVPALLAASDAFVMTSLWEGLGLVFLEAMASELPVLASDVSAVPEVVLDGVTGRLVPPSDPGAVAAALLELAADPELRRRLGKAGAERVRKMFSLERMVAETLSVYGEVGAARGR